MPFAKGLVSSRSCADLSLLNCTQSCTAESDLEPDEMKDLRSFTGVRSPYKIMAVSPEGSQIMFKKDNKTLYLYNVDDIMKCCDINMRGIDVCHEDDTIFDIAFLGSQSVVIVLQDSESRLFILQGTLDLNSKTLSATSPVTATHISCRKHHSTCVIYDETGPVLISYPISYSSKAKAKAGHIEGPKIELLHLSEFYEKAGIRTLTVQPVVKDSNALFCDPFIFRNRLYLFNRFSNSIICISLFGNDKGEVRLLNTYPDPKNDRPNNKYANKSLLLLDDILLAYFHQRLDKADEEPQLWKLELGSMNWRRLQLSLNHHYPAGRVTLQRAAELPVAFLHGECARTNCQEKAHLYQLSLQQECIKPLNSFTNVNINSIEEKISDSVRRSISSVDIHCPSPSTSSASSSPKPSTSKMPPSMRYASKRNSRDKGKRSSSVSAVSKLSTISLSDSPHTQSSTQYVRWSEEMVSEGDAVTLSEQLILAKDMGYTDDEITQAVSMNCAKDGSYRPFSSTNAMIDMLARVQRMCESSGTSNSVNNSINNNNMITSTDSGLELDKSYSSRCSPPHTPASGVRRTTSFHSTTSAARTHDDDLNSPLRDARCLRSKPFQLQRLLDAFEKEQKRFSDESTRSIKILEEKCKQLMDKEEILKSRLESKDQEIQSLKAQLHDQATLAEQLKAAKAKLASEEIDNRNRSDQIRVLTMQAEAVKKQHDSEILEKVTRINELLSKLNSAEDANRPLREKNIKLQKEIDELTKQLTKKQAELDKCSNYYDEIRKAEQLIEEIRLERDEFRSTLNKIPTCVICLDKRPQMLYMPCSHFVCCESCGSRFEQCPTCRQKICGKITVFQ